MHIISGELRKAPYIKPNVGQNGESTLFIVELSEMIKDRQTGEKTYTNYSAAIFAKGGQTNFYQSVLVEGNFIVVTGDKIKIKVSECGQYTKLELENARLENSKYIEATNQQQAPQQNQGFQQQAQRQQQGGYNQQAPQQQQQYAQQAQQGNYSQQAPQNRQQKVNPQEPSIDFDSDIPF